MSFSRTTSYTYNFSNVKFYEYDRIDAALTLTRGF